MLTQRNGGIYFWEQKDMKVTFENKLKILCWKLKPNDVLYAEYAVGARFCTLKLYMQDIGKAAILLLSSEEKWDWWKVILGGILENSFSEKSNKIRKKTHLTYLLLHDCMLEALMPIFIRLFQIAKSELLQKLGF